MRAEVNVLVILAHFSTLIFADDSSARARSVQEDAIKAGHDLGQLPAVVVADDGVCDAEPVHVAHHGLAPVLVGVVGEDHACVVHDGRDVRGLAAGRARHVQHPLPGLRGQRHHGQQGGGALSNINNL